MYKFYKLVGGLLYALSKIVLVNYQPLEKIVSFKCSWSHPCLLCNIRFMHCMTYDLKFLSAFNCYSNVFLLLTPTHRLAFIIKCNRIMIHKKKIFWKIMVLISDKVWMTVTLHFGEFLQLIYIPMHLILRVLHL